MPHDRKGNLLEAGDLVMIPARVKDVMAGDEYCNVTVELEESMPPYDHKDSYTLNTKQVELVQKVPSEPEGLTEAEYRAETVNEPAPSTAE